MHTTLLPFVFLSFWLKCRQCAIMLTDKLRNEEYLDSNLGSLTPCIATLSELIKSQCLISLDAVCMCVRTCANNVRVLDDGDF